MVPNGGTGEKVKSKPTIYGLKAIWEALRCSLIKNILSLWNHLKINGVLK